MSEKKKKFKIPKRVATCADRMYEIKMLKAELNKKLQALDDEFKALKKHLINTLPKSDSSGTAGKLARATIVEKSTPVVEDWPKFYAYVKKKNAFELLRKQLTPTAVVDRWEEGEKIPGVVEFNYKSVSLNKV